MSKPVASRQSPVASETTAAITAGLKRRYRAERRFKAYGVAALAFAGLMLVILLVTIIRPGLGGFMRHELKLEVDTSAIAGALRTNPEAIDFYTLTQTALKATVKSCDGGDASAVPPLPLRERVGVRGFEGKNAQLASPLTQPLPRRGEGSHVARPVACGNASDDFGDKVTRHQFFALAGTFAAFDVKRQLLAHPEQWGQPMTVWVPLADNADQLLKGRMDRKLPEAQRAMNDRQIAWLDAWEKQGRIRTSFNRDFFTRGDSRAPEAAGFMGAIVGSLISLFVCLIVALPIAIMAAITLEEFAGKSRVAEALEVVINNLAAVPSIIYGLLGLSVYLQLFGMPRSSPLVGGLTLAMLIMPVMIIASRAAIRAVPPSMRLAAAGLGATPLQVVRDHVLPYALPGILTGTILSICRALGESAPLLMIGMVAFVADIPRGLTDPATTMPVEIYLWASSPELGFIEKTSSAILVLLVILLLLNMAAIKLRNKSQLSWN